MKDPIRYRLIMAFFSIGGFLLLANLFEHQVLNQTYKDKAQSRTLIRRNISPPRGLISDRNNKLLVVNEPTYELEVIYREIDKEMDVKSFCELLSIDVPTYNLMMENATSRSYFRRSIPITFLSNIDPLDFSRFQEHLHRFPGFYTRLKNKRSYPYPNAAHVLGYISQVSTKDLKNNEQYDIGDIKGTKGLELVYETDLRGENGMEYILKDNIGREVETYLYGSQDTFAKGGEDIRTSLDIDLQAYGESLLGGKRGSIVAIEPKTGEILSIISSPTYDPNSLSLGKERNKTYFDLLTDTINRPMLDRSIQGKYPPGSIFKPILGLVALQEKTTFASRTIYCSGEYVINEKKGFSQGCRQHPTPFDIGKALQYSCNTYFYQLIRELLDNHGYHKPGIGLNVLDKYLEAFGLGKKLGVDMDNENDGFIPTPAYFDRMYNTSEYSWRSTYVLSLGIGQGELGLTTIQMANLVAILANQGHFYTPHLLKSYSSGKPIEEKFLTKHTVPIDIEHFEPILNGMEAVVNAGTGRRASVPGVRICGKTGTSQNPHGEDHSVFFGFGPREDPKIAIAVFVENAGGGGALAAPIGGLMIEKYLNRDIKKSRAYLENYIKERNLIDIP